MSKRTPRESRMRDFSFPPEMAMAAPVPMMAPQAPLISVQILGSKNATVAKATLHKPTADWTGQEYSFEAADSAKREQGDKYDPLTGELLAVSRALSRLARQVAHQANERIQEGVMAHHQELLDKMHKPSKGQVKHRTLAEWQEIQRRSQQAADETLAKNLGLGREEWREHRSSAERVTEWGGDRKSTEVIRLGDGQTLIIGNDTVEIEDDASGEVIAHFHRAK